MASLSYDEIFSNFLGNITDPVLAEQTESLANEIMVEYLHKAVSAVYVRRLFSSIILDDGIQTLTFTMKKIVDEEADKDFVSTLLGKSMAVQWTTPQVQSKVNMAQMFTGSTKKFFSQSNHLSELRALKSDMEKDLQSYILTRGSFYNDYVEG